MKYLLRKHRTAPKRKATETLSLRVTAERKAKLEILSERTHRTMSSFINQWIDKEYANFSNK